jgi:hypothetical protein
MKELFDSINLPKQILYKTEKVISTIFGPSAKELGELFADRIRYKRLKNQVAIFSKVADILEENNLKASELKLKTLVPLIENSSLEDDELLQTKWANLIANICSSPEDGLEPKLVKTLSNLSTLEAQVLDYIFETFIRERELIFDRSKNSKYLKYNSIDDVSLNVVTIRSYKIRERFKLSKDFTSICIDNLVSLGLIKFEEPEVQIENLGKGSVLFDDEGQSVDFSDAYASYNQSDDINMTAYGIYFVSQCKNENAT